jgi:hypothetical protein
MCVIFLRVHLRSNRSVAADFEQDFSMAKRNIAPQRKTASALRQDTAAVKAGETKRLADDTPKHVSFSYITK